MSAKGGEAKEGLKLIAKNPTAFANYFIEEVVEAGIVLMGTEVKSIRKSSPTLKECFVEINSNGKSGGHLEAWILNMHVGPYSHGNIWNHEPTRRRKLLLHRHQIEKIYGAITQKGLTVIPTRIYFKNGKAKVELGIGKGKKKFDKRQDIKDKSASREIDRALKKSLQK